MPESILDIHDAHVLRIFATVETVLDEWNGVGILACARVDRPVVDAEAILARLADEDHGRGPRGIRRDDDLLIQELINKLFDDSLLDLRVAIGSLFDWFLIREKDAMLDSGRDSRLLLGIFCEGRRE